MREKVRKNQPQVLCLSTAKFVLVLCCIFYSSMLCFIHLSIDQIKVLSKPWAPGTQISTALYSTGSHILQRCGCKVLPEENNEPMSVFPYSTFTPLTYALLLGLPVCKSKPAYIYTQKRQNHKFCFFPAWGVFYVCFSLSELLFVLLDRNPRLCLDRNGQRKGLGCCDKIAQGASNGQSFSRGECAALSCCGIVGKEAGLLPKCTSLVGLVCCFSSI